MPEEIREIARKLREGGLPEQVTGKVSETSQDMLDALGAKAKAKPKTKAKA